MTYINSGKVPRLHDAYLWVRRSIYQCPSIMFTAQLPDRFLDCWMDSDGMQHMRTRPRFTRVEAV